MQTNDGIMQMTINQMSDTLANAYANLIKTNVSLRKFPSIMLWGAPGVGKSQGVRQIAQLLGEKTGKRVVVTDVRLLLFNPVDLRGIPTANAEKTLAVWLKPKIFQMDDSNDVVNILFLDEISAAPQSVQAAAYQITLDHTVGEHKLPENCIVIAAGNRVTDKSVAFNMPKALANRLCHIEVESHQRSWHDWAVKANIHQCVLGFLDANPEFLMDFQPEEDGLAFPTPRSWEMVSNVLNYTVDTVKEAFPIIVGCVGERAAYALLEWDKVYDRIPEAKDVFDGKEIGLPTRPEALYALSAKIISYARNVITEKQLNNAVEYVVKMQLEFRNRVFMDFVKIKRLIPFLKRNELYSNWFLRMGLDWDDYE